MINWIPYLESVCRDYAKWWEVYTLTDVAGKKPLEQRQNISPLLDLGLMVQTVESEEKQRERPEEKIERLTVLEGLRKYAPNHVLLVGRPGSGKSTALARLLLEEAEKLRSSIGLPLGSTEIRETPLLEEAEKLRSPLSPPFSRGGTRETPLGTGETRETPAFQKKDEGETKETPLGREETGKTPPLERGVGGDRPKIPILIELRYSQTSVLSRIQAFIHKHHPTINIDTATLETLLRQGEFLLLFDGFNEMASEAARQLLRIFRQDYPKTAMVFTTRDLSLGGDLGIEKRLEMLPMTESQMQEFVCAYLPFDGEKLWQQLQGRLRELGETPMFLLMLCSVFGYNKVIPANLGLVFRSFTQTYSGRLKQDVPVDESSRLWWDRLLQELAWVMTNGESKTEIMVAISRPKAEEVLTEFLRGEVVAPTDCAMRWLEDLLEHHLIQVGDDGQISFRHQLLQEYYVAERLLSLLSGLSDYELQWDYLNYLKWTEVVALMLGLVENEALAVQVVRLALEVDWFLGARLVGQVQGKFQELAFVEVERLELPVLVKVKLAGLTKSDVAIRRLIPLLEHSNFFVRGRAAEALGKIGSETVIPELVQSLEDSDSYVRSRAAFALSKIGSETAIEALIQLRKKSDSDEHSSSETAIPGLISLLEYEDSYVCWNAAEALGKIGSETVIPELIPLLEFPYSIKWGASHICKILFSYIFPIPYCLLPKSNKILALFKIEM
ncbi:NACHT domain-containing NTPase, partial [Okeania sp. SIO2F5]|uniref:NACHT domain-containing protein n=1 Tax=Okeania sp. SIO2F5 TaxID=2607794 RepID=UPI0013BB1514